SGTLPSGTTPGAPGTLVLFGGSPLDCEYISGARVTAGGYLPGSEWFGLQASGIILPNQALHMSAASGPLRIPMLRTPFFNAAHRTLDSRNAASPANPGSIVDSASTMMWSVEGDLFANVARTDYFNWNVITGFRHFNLSDQLVLHQNRTIGSIG